jgi:hypothetical protein
MENISLRYRTNLPPCPVISNWTHRNRQVHLCLRPICFGLEEAHGILDTTDHLRALSTSPHKSLITSKETFQPHQFLVYQFSLSEPVFSCVQALGGPLSGYEACLYFFSNATGKLIFTRTLFSIYKDLQP